MENFPYIVDGSVILIIMAFALIGYFKGFIVELLSFLPMVAALGAVKFLTPVAGRLLRATPLFSSLAESIGQSMDLERMIGEGAMRTQTEIIEGMRLPDFLKDSLLENNNPVIYQLLDVEELQGYIAGFLANVCINIVSVILVFVIVLVGVTLLLRALNLVSKLPILNFVNRMSGFLVGGAKGLVLIWLMGIGLTFLQCNAKFQTLFLALEQTKIALPLYENNVLLYLILTIFT